MYQMLPQAGMLAAGLVWKEWKFYDAGFFLMAVPFVFLFGICIGSFLNVVILRLPRGESLVKRASHCMTCGAKIRIIDLIPIFSWLFLRGKCHSCGEKISARYPIVEALTGLLFVADFFVFGLTLNTVLMCIFTSLLIVVAFMDWDTKEVDLRILLLIALLAIPGHFVNDLTIRDRLIGMVCIALPFFIIGEVSRIFIRKKTGEDYRGIELGDTYLMAAAGLFLGWKVMIFAFFVGIMTAVIGGLIQKKVSGDSQFAFCPYLCIGLLLGAMFGETVVTWWLGWLLSSMPPDPVPRQYFSAFFLR